MSRLMVDQSFAVSCEGCGEQWPVPQMPMGLTVASLLLRRIERTHVCTGPAHCRACNRPCHCGGPEYHGCSH